MFEIKTDTVTKAELAEWAEVFKEDHRFAWAYTEEHPNSIVRVASLPDTVHCYVYDPNRGVTIDATLDRICDLTAGCWDGDYHPYIGNSGENYTNYGEFLRQYAGPDSPLNF